MNHVEKARSRVIWQYRNATKFIEWVSTLPSSAQNYLEEPLQQIADLLDIDNAPPVLLQILGRIVGLDVSYDELDVDDPTAVFRILIKTKIAKNTSDSTIDGVRGALEYIITNNEGITVIDNQDMTFSVAFASDLTDLERYMLNNFDIIPRPQGVKFLGFTETAALVQFGGAFSHFGDERAQFTGLFLET